MIKLFIALLLMTINIQPLPNNIEIQTGTIINYFTEYEADYTVVTFDDGSGWILDGIQFKLNDNVFLLIDNKGTINISDDEIIKIEKMR